VALPTANTPGYALFHDRVGCQCVVDFLTLAEQLGLAMGLIREALDVVQLVGNATDSAGVHLEGSAFDVLQRSPAWIKLFRMMGAAVWPREGAKWEGNEHAHGIIPCRHNRLTAYQWTAYVRGYSGLGQGAPGTAYALQWGYGSADPCWRPKSIPTLAQGAAWARSEIERLTMPTPQEIANAVLGADVIAAPKPDKANPNWTPASYLRWSFLRADAAANAAAQARNETAALRQLVAALVAKGSGLTVAEVEQAAYQGAQRAIDETIDDATVTLQVDQAPPA
jgi:hypothetical protein